MRVTRQSLIRIAKESTQERVYNDRTIVAVYLTGSLVGEADPLLGGTADIDLVLVHDSQPGLTRQILRLTPDFHLDIRHRHASEFKSSRELRTDPVLGWELYDPMLLYERENFFHFLQAGLRAGSEFHAPESMLARCRSLEANARRGWLELADLSGQKGGAREVMLFLEAVRDAANSIAELSGGPLAERRLLSDFPARALVTEHPEFTANLFSLLGANQVEPAALASWLEPWKAAFLAASQRANVDTRIHSARMNYYEKAIRALLEGETPLGGLWPLVLTWTLAVSVLEDPFGGPWDEACHQLGLLGPAFAQHVSDLDNYLDEIEAHLDEIAAANGLETSTSV